MQTVGVPANWELNIRLNKKADEDLNHSINLIIMNSRRANGVTTKSKPLCWPSYVIQTVLIGLLQTFINQNRDKRTEYLSIRNLEFTEKRQWRGESAQPNSFSVPKEINGRWTHSNQCISSYFIFEKFWKSANCLNSKVWKDFQNEILGRISYWKSIVITSKDFADFCFESPISIDFQSEICDIAIQYPAE